MMACLVLLSAPTGALASTTKTVVAGGRLAGLVVTNKGRLDNGNTIHMARLLEGEEESPVAIDVGTALSAAAAEGEQDHDEQEEEHLHLFDEDHEDEHLHEDHDEGEEGHDDHGEEGHDEHEEEGHDEHEHDEEFHTAHTDEHSEDKPKPWGEFSYTVFMLFPLIYSFSLTFHSDCQSSFSHTYYIFTHKILNYRICHPIHRNRKLHLPLRSPPPTHPRHPSRLSLTIRIRSIRCQCRQGAFVRCMRSRICRGCTNGNRLLFGIARGIAFGGGGAFGSRR